MARVMWQVWLGGAAETGRGRGLTVMGREAHEEQKSCCLHRVNGGPSHVTVSGADTLGKEQPVRGP